MALTTGEKGAIYGRLFWTKISNSLQDFAHENRDRDRDRDFASK